jgi:1,4-alpha-glucan branching enzyme
MLPASTNIRATPRAQFGACPAARGFRFSVWAPTHRHVDLLLHPSSVRTRRVPLASDLDGSFAVTVGDAKAGER